VRSRTDLYPYINVKKTARGEFLFDGAAYTETGLEFDSTNFQFSHSEFRDMLNKFVKEGKDISLIEDIEQNRLAGAVLIERSLWRQGSIR
jgi:hypothetical protein